MTDANSPLPFHQKDLQLLSIEDVSLQLRVSRAFVRLCLDAGCPTRGGKVSAAELLHWLFQHYPAVRSRCGFFPMLPIEGVTPEAARRLRLGNAVITLLQFGESRATERRAKRELRRVRRMVEQALDRA